jgi:zinc protease
VGLEEAREDPSAVVDKRLDRHGNPWPLGDLRHVPDFAEEAAAVKAVTLDQVKAFHRRFVSAQRGEFAAVGDMDVAAVRSALAKAFGDWRQPSGGPEPQARVPRPQAPVAAQRFVEATPDKANANLAARLVLPIDDRHPDHAALLLANHVFGRDTDSRLWTRIREKEGLSYDVRSWFVFPVQDLGTTWNVTAIFAPQNQPRVEKALQEELARSLTEGFTQAELEQGRAGLLKSRQLARAQDGVLVGRLASNLYHERRFEREQQLDDALARVTLAQLNAAWRRHIDPAKLVTAWGGDFRAKP